MPPKEVVELFDEKYCRLQSSDLINFMSNSGWKFAFDFKTNTLSQNAVFPDLKLIESYVLNLRFFIQDNESISIRNLNLFYENYCNDEEIKNKFTELRTILNSELDNAWPFKYKNQKLTFRDIFEGFIYSKLAHSNVEKHKIFHNLTKQTFGYYLVFDYFLRCINLVHYIITMISHLNKIAFVDFEKNE